MDLQGKIEKFNVPDIFQLISSGKRTGTLGIIRNNLATMFYFRDGQITYAYAPMNNHRIGERLIEKGFINIDSLEQALAKQKTDQGKNRLGKILIDDNKINEQQLATILTDQISDIVYKVMSWDKGLFKFYDDKFPTDEGNGLSLSTESLILEGARRADELINLKNQLPDFSCSLNLKQSNGRDKIDISLSGEEWDVLGLCNGKNTVDDILNSSDKDPELVMKVIARLIEMDLVEPREHAGRGVSRLTGLELQINKLAELLDEFLEKA
jgi:hypothetical protein